MRELSITPSITVTIKRRSFVLLRLIGDVSAQERIRDLVLQAYAEHEAEAASEAAFVNASSKVSRIPPT